MHYFVENNFVKFRFNYFLGARLPTNNPISCIFLPDTSSLVISCKSFSNLKTNNICVYVPKETLGEPFSTCHKVEREIPARSETYSPVNFRCKRASLMFSPISSNILESLGSNIVFADFIMFYILYKKIYFA